MTSSSVLIESREMSDESVSSTTSDEAKLPPPPKMVTTTSPSSVLTRRRHVDEVQKEQEAIVDTDDVWWRNAAEVAYRRAPEFVRYIGLFALMLVLVFHKNRSSADGEVVAVALKERTRHYVQHGVDGVDLSQPVATPTPHSEMPALFERVHGIAVEILSDDEHTTCVCAPMFGVAARYMAFKRSKHVIAHAFNVELRNVSSTTCVTEESQSQLFPGRLRPVCVRRACAVTLRYVNALSNEESLAHFDEPLEAACIQAAYDLLNDGKSVYDAAVPCPA